MNMFINCIYPLRSIWILHNLLSMAISITVISYQKITKLKVSSFISDSRIIVLIESVIAPNIIPKIMKHFKWKVIVVIRKTKVDKCL